MIAQGEKRGHLTKTDEPEAQFAGGEGGGGTEIARRTIAQKAYRDRVAHYDLHERWKKNLAGRWQLTGYTSAINVSAPVDPRITWTLQVQRRAAFGY